MLGWEAQDTTRLSRAFASSQTAIPPPLNAPAVTAFCISDRLCERLMQGGVIWFLSFRDWLASHRLKHLPEFPFFERQSPLCEHTTLLSGHPSPDLWMAYCKYCSGDGKSPPGPCSLACIPSRATAGSRWFYFQFCHAVFLSSCTILPISREHDFPSSDPPRFLPVFSEDVAMQGTCPCLAAGQKPIFPQGCPDCKKERRSQRCHRKQ